MPGPSALLEETTVRDGEKARGLRGPGVDKAHEVPRASETPSRRGVRSPSTPLAGALDRVAGERIDAFRANRQKRNAFDRSVALALARDGE